MTSPTAEQDIADRVQGMIGAADRWQKVSPKAVVAGSTAQAENVLTDAIHDIGALWRAAQGFADLIASLRRDLDEALEALTQIEQWAEAYPLTVFPEPDFVKVRELLEAGGITLDSVSASNMRHVLKGVAGIVGPVLRSLSGQSEVKT